MITERLEIIQIPNSYNYLVITTRHTYMFKTLKETFKFVRGYFIHNKKG